MNLLQTYSLWKTNKVSRSLPRMKQFAGAFKSTSLFEASFHLVGQLLVATQVVESITSHFLFEPFECLGFESFKSLVLLFVG